MRDDDHAVGGHARVELERVDVAREAVLERGDRVLRPVAAAAAVGLDVERGGDGRGQLEVLGLHHLAQAVGVVGDDAVHVTADQRPHLGLLVDRPRDHLQPAVVRRADQAVGDVVEVGGEDVRAQLVLDGQRERAVVERLVADRDAGGPRRALEDRRLLRERDAAQAGEEIACLFERAPVEGLDQAAPGELVALDDVGHLAREDAGGDGLLGQRRVELGLDVELDALGAVALGELEDLGQRRHLRAGDGLLGADEGVRAWDVRPPRAAVELLDLLEREVLHELADVRARALQRGDAPLVRDDHHTVLGHARVQLERRHAQLQRVAERGQRVLGPQSASTAMRLQVKGCRQRRRRGQQREGAGHDQHPRDPRQRHNRRASTVRRTRR
jgi:hypothetical protein